MEIEDMNRTRQTGDIWNLSMNMGGVWKGWKEKD